MDHSQVLRCLKQLTTNQELRLYSIMINNLNFPELLYKESELFFKLKVENINDIIGENQIKSKGQENSTICSDPEQGELQAFGAYEQKDQEQIEDYQIEDNNNQEEIVPTLHNAKQNEDWLNFVDYQYKEKEQLDVQQQHLINVNHYKHKYGINDDINLLK